MFVAGPMKSVLRIVRDDGGQDLIEYALLGSFIGLVGVLAFQAMGGNINSIYRSWDSAVANQWEPSAPVSGS